MLWQVVLLQVQVLLQVLRLHAQVAGAGICAANLAGRGTTNPPMPACRRCPPYLAAPACGDICIVAVHAHVRRLGGPANLAEGDSQRALHGKGGVRHPATNWVKQCDAFAMCRPLESTAVRLATSRQGTSLDMP
jgi:hypothetical protein